MTDTETQLDFYELCAVISILESTRAHFYTLEELTHDQSAFLALINSSNEKLTVLKAYLGGLARPPALPPRFVGQGGNQ